MFVGWHISKPHTYQISLSTSSSAQPDRPIPAQTTRRKLIIFFIRVVYTSSMPFGFFNGFGLTSFTSAPSSAEVMYNNMRSSQGGENGIYRNNGYADTEVACTALQLASVYEDSQRALEQLNPDFVTILLKHMEAQAGISPDTSMSEANRRNLLKASVSKIPLLQNALVLSYLQQYVSTGIVSVSFPKLTGFSNFPPTNSYYTYSPNPTPSFIQSIDTVGSGNSISFRVRLLSGESPKPSLVYCFLKNMWLDVNQVTINTVARTPSLDNHVGKGYTCMANIPEGISQGESGSTMSCPLWPTGNRRVRVAITQSLSEDSRNLNYIKGALERILSAGTVYEFVRTPQDSTFTLDQDRLNIDRLL